MLFSSNVFIFFFLPFVIAVYYILLRKHRAAQNVFLCIMSLFFYAWGEPKFVLVMMLSIVINWIGGLLVDRYRHDKIVKPIIAIDIIFNLTIIFIFKYLNFTVDNINNLLSTDIQVKKIALPIGISFFTFQAISYVIDVYRQKGEAQKSILNVALYISFFPQLIAGPIVRYETIADQIKNRVETVDDFTEGVSRFIIGFAKKILISNNMALVADAAFAVQSAGTWMGEPVDFPISMAWLGALAYTFQIFFDFSGYSDMAIGLGRMFGFHFLENFNYPYISRSATEFWRRWHMSLGTWFRDYVYFPLGGSRVDTKRRHIFNLFVVWFCTGVWHGANWTFITWGLLYWVLLVFEKFTFYNKLPDNFGVNACKYIYTMFFVIMGWVIFRSVDLAQAAQYMKAMFNFSTISNSDMAVFYFNSYRVFFIAAALFSLPIVPAVKKWLSEKASAVNGILSFVLPAALFIISLSFIVKGSYNPFIYFNF